jgi:hypothetical protein
MPVRALHEIRTHTQVTEAGKLGGVSVSRWEWLGDIAATFGGAHRIVGIPLCRPRQYTTPPPQPLASLLEVGMNAFSAHGFKVNDSNFAAAMSVPGVAELMAAEARAGGGSAAAAPTSSSGKVRGLRCFVHTVKQWCTEGKLTRSFVGACNAHIRAHGSPHAYDMFADLTMSHHGARPFAYYL